MCIIGYFLKFLKPLAIVSYGQKPTVCGFPLIFALAACGSVEEKKLGVGEEAKQGSYLLAFKRSGPSELSLGQRFGWDFRIKSFEFLSSVSLSDGADDSYVDGAVAQVDFWKDEEAHELLSKWEAEGELLFWEPNWWSRLSGSPVFRLDDYADASPRWWVEGIKLFPALHELDALSLTAALESPVIAVLDSGIDYEHPALLGRVWEHPRGDSTLCPGGRFGCNTAEAKGSQLGDGSVYPLGALGPGRACSHRGGLREGDCAHGTHVAGVIVGNPEEGVMGVCPTCLIMNLRVVENVEGEARIADGSIVRALKYVSSFQTAEGKNLVRVVNLSFGKYQKGQTVSLIIKYLSQLRDGILVIGAAGNEDSQSRVYPAAHPLALGVTGLAASGRKASYSNFGPWVDIAAPGGESREGDEMVIESSAPGGGFSYSQGTSMAVPIVAGVAGLVLSVYPELSIAQLKHVLVSTADARIYDEKLAEGYNFRNYQVQVDRKTVPLLGSGIVDAWAALKNAPQAKGQTVSLGYEEKRVSLKCGGIGAWGSTGGWISRFFYFMLPLVWVIGFWLFVPRVPRGSWRNQLRSFLQTSSLQKNRFSWGSWRNQLRSFLQTSSLQKNRFSWGSWRNQLRSFLQTSSLQKIQTSSLQKNRFS